MGKAVGAKQGVKNEINVTPLVDVVLVLLIIFMVITPMLQRGKEVTLPKAESTEKGSGESDPLILSITPDEKVYVEKFEYKDDALQMKLEDEFRRAPDRKILLKGDTSLSFGAVRKVMDVARKAGAKGVGLGVEQLKD